MNQTEFEHLYQDQWLAFDQLLELLESGEKHPHGRAEKALRDFPSKYRRLCHHYSLASNRHYSPSLVDRLHSLVLRGHCQLYRRRQSFLWQGLRFLARDFPRTLRDSALLFWLAFGLFFGPAVAMGLATYHNPVNIYSIMDEQQVSQMESMYNPRNNRVGKPLEHRADTPFAMFGYYIRNNVSIGFRTFATGIVFGTGSIFFLIYNGLLIGGIAGHLSQVPFASQFWPFVSGHSAFELTAIIICGAAGLHLGRSLILPGRYRRIESLRLQAPTALKLVIGAAVMLLVAAFIEAFWSSLRFSPVISFWVGAINWCSISCYFLFCGKTRP